MIPFCFSVGSEFERRLVPLDLNRLGFGVGDIPSQSIVLPPRFPLRDEVETAFSWANSEDLKEYEKACYIYDARLARSDCQAFTPVGTVAERAPRPAGASNLNRALAIRAIPV